MKALIVTVAAILAALVTYCMFAFYSMKLDPSLWSQDARLGYLLIGGWCVLAVVMFADVKVQS